jgi:hypothetical protein
LRTCNVHEVAADEMILDLGPQAVEALADVLKTCRTLVWNGPLGAFETAPFDAATVALARTAAALTQERLAAQRGGRRRYGGGAQPCRCGGGFHLYFNRWRRLPRMDGRQAAARPERPSLPVQPGLFDPLVDHPKVLRVVALSGGYKRPEACAELSKNRGIIASFSRALLEDLRAQMSDEEFNASLGSAIDEIYTGSTRKI